MPQTPLRLPIQATSPLGSPSPSSSSPLEVYLWKKAVLVLEQSEQKVSVMLDGMKPQWSDKRLSAAKEKLIMQGAQTAFSLP